MNTSIEEKGRYSDTPLEDSQEEGNGVKQLFGLELNYENKVSQNC